ncbi:acyl-coenzyme A thioesterase THEM4-like [Pantherophis guttatus]|uniref:Acyl-coenzyme A thioesterase THEM4 n=1 Tax=Pantherophis guttatus TaxID=94885 RepID=A0A6P9D7B3_PANGU|nr:acyl-coenzyme A thioesterase THEM4-like [Pantherophis guttatus]XP_034291561.1 acyl-coenzyme A thioesterase THEM4-like [Pantherophis guttatus]XP_034291562.1 acyl-coenzyme A thioesterase THEM4-like [Pantherophis guttatus]
MLRHWARLRRGLPCFVTPRNRAQGTIPPTGVPQRFSHKLQGNSPAWLVTSEKSKDWAVPNPSWSQEMMIQFNRFMEMTKDGRWRKLPSYRSYSDHLPEGLQKEELQSQKRRLFLRNIDREGMGFEYAMFMNLSEKRVAAVFQMGPYLEGPSGFTHGGAIATVLDSMVGSSVFSVSRRIVTANLNINYRSPVALGSVVLVDSRVDKIEGRKFFASGEMRSTDGQTLHAEATGLFIELQPQKETDSSSSP